MTELVNLDQVEDDLEEPTGRIIRFTVDMPEAMHRDLSHLAVDLGKPKVKLVRQAIAQMIEDHRDESATKSRNA